MFAVLIDSDNVSPKYIKYIFDEISNYGIATYKRIYGDWTSNSKGNWKNIALENSIMPIQQYSYTTGKNATDSSMIIDAMDILYSNHVDGFCLVSSDSDFTRLAARLRESGMMVIGMGEKKTPKPFSSACNIFKYLESLAAEDEPVTELDIKTIEETIIDIINENSGDSSEMNTGEMRNRLVKRYPEFDVRNYGYTKFSSFLNTMSSLELKNNATMVKVKKSEYSIQQVYKTIIHLVSENKNKKINLGELNQKLMEKILSFKVKDYGYSKFSKLIADIKELQLDGQNEVKMKKEK
ncbi:MAG: NYN domain-containing protein [Lachnospiraceae bacterium]|nr:NYN domain-containing protein [Lachnospiraceae bacterium]